jgi:hypothetical protein
MKTLLRVLLIAGATIVALVVLLLYLSFGDLVTQGPSRNSSANR